MIWKNAAHIKTSSRLSTYLNMYGCLVSTFTANIPKGKRCVYFDTYNLTDEEVYYSSHFIKNETNGTYQYHGRFYTTNFTYGQDEIERERPNSIRVTTITDSTSALPEMNYSLIFSDYENCSIYRLTSINISYACMVLVTDQVMSTGLSGMCNTTYTDACGKNHTLEKVPYNSSCSHP
ncbi:hypothetical protein MTO96_031646 [Rhipicephalus appendiculatus]